MAHFYMAARSTLDVVFFRVPATPPFLLDIRLVTLFLPLRRLELLPFVYVFPCAYFISNEWFWLLPFECLEKLCCCVI